MGMKMARAGKIPELDDNLESNLLCCHRFSATNLRDKIWALLGIIGDAWRFAEDVNYAMSAEDVFTVTARKLLAGDPKLNILHAAGIGNPGRIDGLPSWVPDWSSLTHTILRGVNVTMRYNASGATSNSPHIDHENRTLRVSGRLVDTVSLVFPEQPRTAYGESPSDEAPPHAISTSHGKKEVKLVERWINDALRIARCSDKYTDETGRERAFSVTLTANISFSDGPGGAPTTGIHFDDFQAWRRANSAPPLLNGLGNFGEGSSEEASRANAYGVALGFVAGRRVFVTEEGYFGLGPEGLSVGDRVVVLGGAVTPFLVRGGREGAGDGGRVFELVGESYVHGLMDGEGLSMTLEERIVLA